MIYIYETYINKDENLICGYSGYYESYYSKGDKLDEVFKGLSKIHGKCISKIYIDKKNGMSIPVGYVFIKKMKYTDCKESFTQETWVELFKKVNNKYIPIYIDRY